MGAFIKVRKAISNLMEEYKEEDTVVGHSLGATLAILNATDIVFNGFNKQPTTTTSTKKVYPVTAIVLRCPHVRDQGFANVFFQLKNLHVLRVRNLKDLVPNHPLDILEYVHIGKKLMIDTTTSPYLKNQQYVDLKAHDLGIHLHGIARPKVVDGKNVLVIDRDIAWVNKGLNELKDEFNVVAQWWVKEKKSMVQMDDGKWVLKDRDLAEENDYI